MPRRSSSRKLLIARRSPECATQCAEIGRLRQIAALDLMPSLRACFHALQTVLDRPIDGAVVAKLEMQEWPVAAAAPVAAIQRLAASEVQRARHRLAGVLRHHQHHALAQPLAEQREERARQISRPPFAIDCRAIEPIERIPMRLGDVRAVQGTKRQAGRVRIAPFTSQHLALARRQRTQEVVEAAIACVLPVELHAHTLQPARLARVPAIPARYRM